MNTPELLSAKEYDHVGKAIFESLYELIPKNIQLDYQSVDGISHIGFISVPGGKYLNRDVTGGFQAVLPFQMVYRFIATNNGQRMAAEQLLDEIADQLENKDNYPKLSENREITEIVFNSIPYRSRSEQDGSIVYVRNGEARFEKDI